MLPGLENTFCIQLQAANAAVHQPAAEYAREARESVAKQEGVWAAKEKRKGHERRRGVRRGHGDQGKQKSCEHFRS